MQALTNNERNLALDMAKLYADPLGWVKYAYPWGSGVLKGFDGPDGWQAEFLTWIGEQVKDRGFQGVIAVDPIRRATASGHGIGKSALTAWIVGWILATRPHSKGVVTANTSPQLETKTWAEITKWHKRSIVEPWFRVTSGKGSMRMTSVLNPDSWRCDAQTSREENSESFAGLHAATATPFYIFDEASAIPNSIWEVAEGGLTDGEPMIFVFGNPTRNSGKFFECFNRQRHRWNPTKIDSRKARLPNKRQIQEWIDDYGEDSDFVRVRVKGEFPRAGSTQFISSEIVQEAISRKNKPVTGAPFLLGVDVARFGDDQTVICRRKGRIVPRMTKLRDKDTMQVAAHVAKIIDQEHPSAVMVDEVGLGAGVVDRLHQLGYPVLGINSGASPDDENKEKVYNKRAEMWFRMREWLKTADIFDDAELQTDLTSVEYGFDAKTRIQLEKKEDMKKRGFASPDSGDALALTFAHRTPAVATYTPADLMPEAFCD